MSWDAAIYGTLTLPPARFAEWLRRPVESAQVPDAEKYLSTLELSGKSVKETLAGLRAFEDEEGLAFIELSVDPAQGRVEVRSFVSKDEYLDEGLQLAAVWAAAKSDGVGELTLAGMLTAGFCYRLTVGAQGVTLEKRPDAERKTQPQYGEILARVEARIEELGL